MSFQLVVCPSHGEGGGRWQGRKKMSGLFQISVAPSKTAFAQYACNE